MLRNLHDSRPTASRRLGELVRARFGVLTLGALASCGGAQSQNTDCATTQSIASYTHPREVAAESQHASSGGYLEFGDRRCTVYVDYVAGQPLKLRLWTAHHCYDPTQGKNPVLALYDRGRYVEYPVLLEDAASAAGADLPDVDGVVKKAMMASFSGIPRAQDTLEAPYAQCLAFEADAKKAKGAGKGKGQGVGSKGDTQRVCASYHDLVVFEASLPSSLSEPARTLLAAKADAQEKARGAALASLPESSRAFVATWRNAYDTYLFYKRLSSLGAFYRDALVARSACATDLSLAEQGAPSPQAAWCGLDALVDAHVDTRLAAVRDGRGNGFDANAALALLERLKEEPAATRDAVSRKYFLVENFAAFEAALSSLKGETLDRFLVQGADLLLFYAGKAIEDAWARLQLGAGTSEVSLARAPFLFHSNAYFVAGDAGREDAAKHESLLGPYFVKRQAVALAGASDDATAMSLREKGKEGAKAQPAASPHAPGLKVANGALLFERTLTPGALRVLPGDSGSLFTLFDLPVAVVSMVNGAPTSGGQVLRPLPKQTAEQEPPGEGSQSNTAEGSAQAPAPSGGSCQL